MAASHEQVSIVVPSSTANVGLYYDVGSLGLSSPTLTTTLTRNPDRYGVNVHVKSPNTPPRGRELGHAGKTALSAFFEDHGIEDESVDLHYEDNGYPVGGLGRSGAEAVGAVMAAAVIYDVKLSRDQIAAASAKGEPGRHMDNVAGSLNGRFNIISKSPFRSRFFVDYYSVPEDLGITIGLSSHQKTGGTEEGRKVLADLIDPSDFVTQSGLIAAATAALISGDIDGFLEYVTGDRYHEVRRANVGFYGNFNAKEFMDIKDTAWGAYGVALNVSGAGPNMELMYNKKKYPNGIDAVKPVIAGWFSGHDIVMNFMDTEVSPGGAYDYAERIYSY